MIDSQTVTLGVLQRVLQSLLSERVPVRELRSVLETLGDYADVKDVEVLTEYVRTALRRSICNLLLKESREEVIHVLTVSNVLEEMIKDSIHSTPIGVTVALPPEAASQMYQQMNQLVDQMIANGQQPVVLAAPHVRLAFRKLTASSFPSLYVLSYNEIAPDVEVSAVGVIRLEDENQEIHSEEHAASPAAGA